jgi:hypothetical protein
LLALDHPQRLLLGQLKRLLSAHRAKCFEFVIMTVEEKIVDIHMDPVRAGFVEQTTDWKWSSARWYENRPSGGVPISWIDSTAASCGKAALIASGPPAFAVLLTFI